jgi:branched-chain amino acid transport system ATP-binding protein
MTPEPLMRLRGLSKRFGGLTAVEVLDLDLYPGEILALIGPNGAGKTTTFNMIAGAFPPSAGTIELAGQRIDGLPVHRIAGLGLMRTFQHNMPFTSMSLIDNVLVGSHTKLTGTLLDVLVGRRLVRDQEAAARAHAQELIAFVGLMHRIEDEVATLSFGEGRLLELARALAGRPRTILLDEPAAGLTQAETTKLGAVIKEIATRGIAVLLIEHNMHFLLPLAQRIAVLNFGKKIAEGTAAEITRHPEVVQAYLGSAAAAGMAVAAGGAHA